jgi:hypothetical protein
LSFSGLLNVCPRSEHPEYPDVKTGFIRNLVRICPELFARAALGSGLSFNAGVFARGVHLLDRERGAILEVVSSRGVVDFSTVRLRTTILVEVCDKLLVRDWDLFALRRRRGCSRWRRALLLAIDAGRKAPIGVAAVKIKNYV